MMNIVIIWLQKELICSYSVSRYSRAREVEHMFLSTVAVFFTEVMKCVVCLAIILKEETPSRFLGVLMDQVVRQPYDTLKVCVPAMVYIVQNNLFYIAASHLDAATFMKLKIELKVWLVVIFNFDK
ncbi:UDP-galactose/UDP-N-acetylglucosamine transporter srf-3 domain protein [Cooperia oncophora]